MAMGGRGQGLARDAIACNRPFINSTGSLRGTRGSTRDLGWLEQHSDAARIRELLSRATYVVWSYDTPIGFVVETEEGNVQQYYVDESHSMTTSHHQSIVRQGFGDYETVGSRRRVRRPRREPVVRYGDGPTFRAPQHVPEPDNSGPEFIAPTEDRQQATLQRLLDPRYADPNGVPGRDPEADREAELRDAERIAREGVWTL
jgi:hypothetical protein